MALQNVVNQSQLEPALLELVKIRASQINRCAFCIDMHFRAAQVHESPDRLYLLDAWEEVESQHLPRIASCCSALPIACWDGRLLPRPEPIEWGRLGVRVIRIQNYGYQWLLGNAAPGGCSTSSF